MKINLICYLIMFMMISTVYANDIYITQSGATLDLDITTRWSENNNYR